MTIVRKVLPSRFTPEILVPGRVFAGRGFAMSYAEAHRRADKLMERFNVAFADGNSGERLRPAEQRLTGYFLHPASSGKSQVLLGGAGFLGSRIAASLLLGGPLDAGGNVVIVSRTPKTIRSQWATFLGDREADRLMADPRLRLVSADLSSPDMAWMKSVPTCSVVYHLAAQVHAFASYERLSAVNINSALAGLCLAQRDDALLQHAGTLSVFVSSNCRREAIEASLPRDEESWLYGGYAQTKAVAEIAIERIAAEIKLRWQIVRFGLLVPEPAAPFPADSFFRSILSGLEAVGCVPDAIEEAFVDLTPVSSAAGAAVRLAGAGMADPRTLGIFHWANPQSAALSEFIAAVDEGRERVNLGPLKSVCTPLWEGALSTLPRLQRLLLLSSFAKSDFILQEAIKSPVLNADLFQSTGRSWPSVKALSYGIAPILPPSSLLPDIISSARIK